jgi:hypothetical protein
MSEIISEIRVPPRIANHNSSTAPVFADFSTRPDFFATIAAIMWSGRAIKPAETFEDHSALRSLRR